MFVHIFLFRWKRLATDVDKARAIREIQSLKQEIPAIHELQVGNNISSQADGFELAGVMTFEDARAYAVYNTHAAHQALLSWLVPLIDAVEVDFNA